jgi:hypothetical protein
MMLHAPLPPSYVAVATVIASSPLPWHSRASLLCKLDRHYERDDPVRFARFAARAARLLARKGK